MDFGWRFHLGRAADPRKDCGFGAIEREGTFAKASFAAPAAEKDFDEGGWQPLDLPHDWALDLPFVDGGKNLSAHGSKPIGREYPETRVGWYRRKFSLPSEDDGMRIHVEFDRVFRDAMVFFNGHFLRRNFCEYLPFEFDLTDYANFGGENLLVVRVDATFSEGWYYEGAVQLEWLPFSFAIGIIDFSAGGSTVFRRLYINYKCVKACASTAGNIDGLAVEHTCPVGKSGGRGQVTIVAVLRDRDLDCRVRRELAATNVDGRVDRVSSRSYVGRVCARPWLRPACHGDGRSTVAHTCYVRNLEDYVIAAGSFVNMRWTSLAAGSGGIAVTGSGVAKIPLVREAVAGRPIHSESDISGAFPVVRSVSVPTLLLTVSVAVHATHPARWKSLPSKSSAGLP